MKKTSIRNQGKNIAKARRISAKSSVSSLKKTKKSKTKAARKSVAAKNK